MTIKDGRLHTKGESKQTDPIQSIHDSLQKDIDTLQNKLDCLTEACYWAWIGKSPSGLTYLTHGQAIGVRQWLPPFGTALINPLNPIKKYFEQTLDFDVFSVVLMVILSFKLLKSLFSTFKLKSRWRGVVLCRKYFKQ
jgi:hypothetical protein